MNRCDNLEKERRAFLRQELKDYEKTISDLTSDEKKELREWIKRGRSVYDNPWYISMENGWPMDYVGASRAFDDLLSDPDEYCPEYTDGNYSYDTSGNSSYDNLITDELPF
jgi:hypothetical protein